MAYVADVEAAVHILSLDKPKAPPKFVGTLQTTGTPRDVVVDRAIEIYVALGGSGVDVFDATIPDKPALLKNVAGRGSAQAVAATEDYFRRRELEPRRPARRQQATF